MDIFNPTTWEILKIPSPDLSGYVQRLKKTSSAMSGTSLSVSDSDITSTSWIVWTASSIPNGFIETVVTSWNVTFNSTVAETCSFTYYILN